MRGQTAPSAEDYFNSAMSHIRLGEKEKALSDLSKAVSRNPDYAMAFLLRGNLREQKGELEAALADYDRAIELVPDAPGMEAGYNDRSILRLTKGDIAGAREDINKAIKLNPRVAAFYNQRAVVQFQDRNYAAAAADYDKALELNPKLPSAYYGRGGYRLKTGDFAGAVADYNNAIELLPGYFNAYVSRGIARGLGGDLDGAIEDIKKGASLNAAAVSDQSRANFTSPFNDLCQFILDNPTEAKAYELRGILRLLQGKAAEAEQDFLKSIQIAPGRKFEIESAIKKVSGAQARAVPPR